MSSRRCVCGCGRRGVQKHHVVYVQELRRAGPDRFEVLRVDPRNLVPVAPGCHAAHHARSVAFPVRVLPDSVFEFAAELLGGPAAFEYLSRRYRGGDPRLEALLTT